MKLRFTLRNAGFRASDAACPSWMTRLCVPVDGQEYNGFSDLHNYALLIRHYRVSLTSLADIESSQSTPAATEHHT